MENSGKQNPKMGFKSPPEQRMLTSKWFFMNNLRSKELGQIQNLYPHRLMSRLKSKTTPDDTLRTRPYSYRRLDLKDRFDGDTGRPEFGLRGQRGGTESNKGTAANSLSSQGKSLPSKSALALPTNPLPSVKS
jgi:hypothetical protein